MSSFNVLVLPGDHVGPEVMAEAIKVIEAIEKTSSIKFNLKYELAGGCSIDKYGVPVTDEVLKLATESDAVLFGSVGGPKWGHKQPGPEGGLLALRKALKAYANVRPCRFPSTSLHSLSPIKSHLVAGTDFIIVRENCGGAYFGSKIEEDDKASDDWIYTRPEVERVARFAAHLAKETDPPKKVWSCDKANVLASGRLWRRVVQETFDREFPELELGHQLADSAAMIMVKDPRYFNGIMVTDNTFGDMLSDEAAVIPGSLGLLPSGSLCGIFDGEPVKGMYEPVHGSAPDISGKGIVNPVAMILSLAMMLKYSFGLKAESDAIEDAVQYVLDDESLGGLGLRTGDLGGTATTVQIGDAITSKVTEMLMSIQNKLIRK